MYLPFAINIMAEKCMLLIPKKIQLSTEMYLPFAINIIAKKCMLLIQKKKWQKEKNFNVSSEENNVNEKEK